MEFRKSDFLIKIKRFLNTIWRGVDIFFVCVWRSVSSRGRAFLFPFSVEVPF